MIDLSCRIEAYLKRLFPISRSITGDGNRETLDILREIIPLTVIEYPTGKKVYDWTIPDEWNIKEAWIADARGNKLISFSDNNLHIVGYSMPVNLNMDYEELTKRLHYIKEKPSAIPYRTAYYRDDWGFCLSYEQFLKLFKKGESYHVYIDSKKEPGRLTVGEYKIQGRSKKEILVSSYICHPSMANDSLSGVIVSALLAEHLSKMSDQLEFSYRFLFVPETIGAITYLFHNESSMKAIESGLVVTTCGGPGPYGYKQSFDPSHEINLLVEEVFQDNEVDFVTYQFDIRGSDERQYSSQGFGINCITLTKDKYYEYDEYHTSLDNLTFVKPNHLKKTLELYIDLIGKIDMNLTLRRSNVFCEPMLNNYHLHETSGGEYIPGDSLRKVDKILWLMHYCNGHRSLYSIAKMLDSDIRELYIISKELIDCNLLQYDR